MVNIKYIGSKNKISKYLLPIIHSFVNDNNIDTYIEPFVGGANLIDKVNCINRIGNDIEALVIELFQECLRNPSFLDNLPELPTREHYFDVLNYPDNYSTAYRAAILYFSSYNARINGGGYGAIANSKKGTTRNYYQEAKRNLQKQLPKLKNIVFTNLDYKDLTIPCNSLVYCDPPYQGCHHKDKVYSNSGFNYAEFWNWCREKSINNIVLVSGYSAPDDFKCIWEQIVKVSMNNNNHKEKVEKLFRLQETLKKG